jgi:pyridoxamine 5'-phosphate oxidase
MSKQRTRDPYVIFAEWMDEATSGEPINPNATALATVDSSGQPSLRMVLLKGADSQGFVFYTNTESQKAVELAANPKAALCFYWRRLGRQVRIEGAVETVSEAEADAYFASRHRSSQIGAWASEQSRPLAGRFDLERAVAKYTAKFGIGAVPRPPFWSGYRLIPARIEFWQEKPFRLHERLLYVRDGDGWTTQYLYP